MKGTGVRGWEEEENLTYKRTRTNIIVDFPSKTFKQEENERKY